MTAAMVIVVLTQTTAPIRAQDPPPITISSTSVEYAFGQQATFEIEAAAPAGISAAYLYIKLGGESRPEQHEASLDSGISIQASIQRDLGRYPFPAFSEVTWWWEIHDTLGNVRPTSQDSFQYRDNRFDWYSTASGPIRVYTVTDDPVYIQSALDTAKASVELIGPELEAPAVESLDLYLYPSAEDIRAAFQMTGREWVGGQAIPELGVILVAIPHDDRALSRMERDIPHELTHHLLYTKLGVDGHSRIPTWLSEGLATTNELRPDPNAEAALQRAHAQSELIPLADLCEPFSADSETAFLSYTQSSSIVDYIRARYGRAGIIALLTAYANGASCETGIIEALDTTIEQLDLAWRADLIGLGGGAAWVAQNKQWLVLWGISLLLALPMAAGLATRPRKEK
jgi:hypothetical protein